LGFGDELMVTGHVRELYAKDPRKVVLEYGKRIWNEVFENNPKIARPEEQGCSGTFQVYRAREFGLRPYAKSKSAAQWGWRDDYRPPIGELFFTRYESGAVERLEPGVIIEPNNKSNASPNKDWGWGNWQELVRLMGLAGIKSSQVGAAGLKLVSGAEWIQTNSFRMAAAVLSRAKAAVLPEGGLHHAAAAVGVKAVVIYGGYISPRQTGYDMHQNIFTGGVPCGNRLRCEHCLDAMKRITPEMVLANLRKILA
jgi:hypothetical protein